MLTIPSFSSSILQRAFSRQHLFTTTASASASSKVFVGNLPHVKDNTITTKRRMLRHVQKKLSEHGTVIAGEARNLKVPYAHFVFSSPAEAQKAIDAFSTNPLTLDEEFAAYFKPSQNKTLNLQLAVPGTDDNPPCNTIKFWDYWGRRNKFFTFLEPLNDYIDHLTFDRQDRQDRSSNDLWKIISVNGMRPAVGKIHLKESVDPAEFMRQIREKAEQDEIHAGFNFDAPAEPVAAENGPESTEQKEGTSYEASSVEKSEIQK